MSPEKHLRPVVLAKGFGQGAGTEEFRVVLPVKPRGPIRSRLDAIRDWGALLAPLYERTAEDLERQYAFLLAEFEFAVFCVAPTKDPFGRRSVVIMGLVGVRSSLSRDARIAAAALVRIREGIDGVATAIQTERLERLQNIAFRVADQPMALPKLESDTDLFRDLLAGRSSAGAATPLMLGLGADVVIGTAHEALDAERKGLTVTAYFDVRTGHMVSRGAQSEALDEGVAYPGVGTAELPDSLRAQNATGGTPTRKAKSTKELLQQILERLDAMEEELGQLRRDQVRILDQIRRKKSWW